MILSKANMLFVLLTIYAVVFYKGANANELLMQTLSKVLTLDKKFDNLETEFMKSVNDVNALDKRMDNMETQFKNTLTDLQTQLAEGLKRNSDTPNDYKPKLGGITKSIESTISNTVTKMVKSQYRAISTAMKREKVALMTLKTEIKNHIKEIDDEFQNAQTSFEERLLNQTQAQEYKFERQSDDLGNFISDVRDQLKGNFSDAQESLDKAIDAFKVDMKNTTFNLEKTLNKNLETVQSEVNLRIVSLISRMSSTEGSLQTFADCSEIRQNLGRVPSGVYHITTWKTNQNASVFCDMDTDQGGWTVFQHRMNGKVDFYRNFSSYENGFGSLQGEFWLGLKLMNEMTSRTSNDLRIDITRGSGSTGYAVYADFSVGAGSNYTLHVGYTRSKSGVSQRNYTFDFT
ncbi:TEuncharacterized [Mya arenaria]|uniref:TEuncharacterized n=1 Tax=Mya arenaria TaxID=6604 RepID=A0ABY7G6A9_MYAAR|nr:TEuncharacterized [Mya arenaria]